MGLQYDTAGVLQDSLNKFMQSVEALAKLTNFGSENRRYREIISYLLRNMQETL
jgi:hypothetical protein